MAEQLYPKPRRELDLSRRPWHVHYEGFILPDGVVRRTWTGYHRTRLGARIAARAVVRTAIVRGTVTLARADEPHRHPESHVSSILHPIRTYGAAEIRVLVNQEGEVE